MSQDCDRRLAMASTGLGWANAATATGRASSWAKPRQSYPAGLGWPVPGGDGASSSPAGAMAVESLPSPTKKAASERPLRWSTWQQGWPLAAQPSCSSTLTRRETRRRRWVSITAVGSPRRTSLLSTACRYTRSFDRQPACLDLIASPPPVSYTHLRAHETPEHLVCR